VSDAAAEYALELLRAGAEFTLYRGVERGTRRPVMAVVATAEQPSPQSLRRLEHEYALAAELDGAWAATPLGLARHEGRTALVLADPGGEPLDRIIEQHAGQSMEAMRFLRIAIGLTAAVAQRIVKTSFIRTSSPSMYSLTIRVMSGLPALESRRYSRFETYKARCEHYLLPAFGKFLITAITKQHVVTFTEGLKTAKRLDRKKGPLSDRTIHHLWAQLNHILDRAVMEQIIQRNPCDLMKPPKKNMPKPSGLEVAGMVALLKGLRDTDLYSFVAVSTFTGFRRGELLGLTSADIDFENNVLQIVRAATEPNRRRALDGTREHSVTTKGPKTTGSRRSHPVFGLLKDALLEHHGSAGQQGSCSTQTRPAAPAAPCLESHRWERRSAREVATSRKW